MSANKKLSLAIIFIAILFSLIAPLGHILPVDAIKDLRFLAPVLVLPFLFLKPNPNQLTISRYFKPLLFIFLISAIYTVVINYAYYNTGLSYRNMVNIIFIVSPVIFSWAILKFFSKKGLEKVITFYFLVFAGIYIIQLVQRGISIDSILNIFRLNLIVASDIETESQISLLMGFYTLFFLDKKKYKWAIAAGLFTLIGGKRIAIFGLSIAMIIYFFTPIKTIKTKRKTFSYFFVIGGLLIILFWNSLLNGLFNNFIESFTGVTIDRFFMGRLSRFNTVLNNLDESLLSGFGYGIGYIENILYYSLNRNESFHGDYYRLYLEMGSVIFTLWLYITGKYSASTKLALSVTFMLLFLMQTDNAFIYDRVMFSYYIILGYSINTDIIDERE